MDIIQRAIEFAVKIHAGQKRKGKEIPYIVHPLTVGLILSRVTDDENVICAGILHDTIEDARPYRNIAKETLAKEFGARIARIVNDVTEQDKTLPWAQRKRQALEHVPMMPRDSLLVKSADVLNNLSDQINDYKLRGDSMFEAFNAPKKAQLERYIKLIAALERAWPKNPLIGELKGKLKKVESLWR